MIAQDCPLEEVRRIFGDDRFATEACGCEVLEASEGHAVCAFTIAPTHLNAQGRVMGGAIFTLADFSLAIACNMGAESCTTGKKYTLVNVEPTPADLAAVQNAVSTISLPNWASVCDKVNPTCSSDWKSVVAPVVGM